MVQGQLFFRKKPTRLQEGDTVIYNKKLKTIEFERNQERLYRGDGDHKFIFDLEKRGESIEMRIASFIKIIATASGARFKGLRKTIQGDLIIMRLEPIVSSN